MTRIYQQWIYEHEHPDEKIERGAAPIQGTPVWIEKMNNADKLREKLGEDKFYEMECNYQEYLRLKNEDEGI